MKIKAIKHNLTLASPTEGYVRTKGLHASDLYNAYYHALDPKRYPDTPFDEKGLTRMELGTSFEEVLEPVLAKRLMGERPGEFTTPEGIIYSPDYLFYEGKKTILGEFKCTSMSTKGAPRLPKFNKWATQMKLYCYWLHLFTARLYVMFLYGNYQRPFTPLLLAWEYTFTETELEEEHDIVMRFAKEEGLLSGKKRTK